MATRLLRGQLHHTVYVFGAAYPIALLMIGGVQSLVALHERGSPLTGVMQALDWLGGILLIPIVPAAVIASLLFGPGALLYRRGARVSLLGHALIGAFVVRMMVPSFDTTLMAALIGCIVGGIVHLRPRLGSARWWALVLLGGAAMTSCGWLFHPIRGLPF